MNPSNNAAPAPGFVPKYRQFHPQSTVWVKNPFEHDVEFQVADELNRRFLYRLPKGRISELPGGLIATLGVKKLVDEVIQTTRDEEGKEQILNIWDARVRGEVEADIIVKVREAPQTAESGLDPSKPINLGVSTRAVPKDGEPDDAPPEDDKPEPGEVDEPLDDEEFSALEQSDSQVIGGPPIPLDAAEQAAKENVAGAGAAAVANLPDNKELEDA